MPRYTRPIAFTVEFSFTNEAAGRHAVWTFSMYQEADARKLFACLENSKMNEVSTPQTLNLVAWDMHPDRDEATGLILDQCGFEA